MSTLYKDMKILQDKDVFEIEVAKFMHSSHHGNLPCIFDIYVGVTIWNKIPLHVKLHSKHLFSKQLKNILISKY